MFPISCSVQKKQPNETRNHNQTKNRIISSIILQHLWPTNIGKPANVTGSLYSTMSRRPGCGRKFIMPDEFEAKKEELYQTALEKWHLKRKDKLIVEKALQKMK